MASAADWPALESIREVLQNPSKTAIDWKAKGKKIVGYRCQYVPEEIIWAADMLPYPVYGTPEPVVAADSYFQSCTCEFIRNIFDHALKGDLEFLDFMVLSNTCDVGRRLYDMWNGYIKSSPVYLINNPQKLLTEGNREYFLEELRRFRLKIEEISGNRITDEKLMEAIELFNRTRTLLKELYDLRKQNPPAITGEEAFTVAMAVSILPKDQAVALLQQLLEQIRAFPKNRAEQFAEAPRVMISGSVLDHPALIRMVEEQGGAVVADDLCNTSRYFWHLAEETDDPLTSLYNYLNNRPLCACMHPMEARLQFLLDLAKQFNVEAVINFNLKYCHPSLYEAPLYKKALEARNIPTACLEVGHDLSGHGQLRTRIQAFLEMVAF